MSTDGIKRRGFASMDPVKQKAIAAKGGRAAHAKRTAHEWTPEEAKLAGQKGGTVSRGGRGKLDDNTNESEVPVSDTNGSE